MLSSHSPLPWGNGSGICPGPSLQTPEGSAAGSPHTSSPHTHPERGRENKTTSLFNSKLRRHGNRQSH